MSNKYVYSLLVICWLALVAGCAPSAEEHSRKGESYIWVKNYAAAINEFKMSAEKDPTNAMTFYHWGFCLLNLGKMEEAVEAFHKAIEMEPGNIRNYINLSIAHDYLGDDEAAEMCLLTALDINPASVQAHFNLATMYMKRGDYDRADMHLRRVEQDGRAETTDIRAVLDSLENLP
jgi:Flp pilus assembly protein TadD